MYTDRRVIIIWYLVPSLDVRNLLSIARVDGLERLPTLSIHKLIVDETLQGQKYLANYYIDMITKLLCVIRGTQSIRTVITRGTHGP